DVPETADESAADLHGVGEIEIAPARIEHHVDVGGGREVVGPDVYLDGGVAAIELGAHAIVRAVHVGGFLHDFGANEVDADEVVAALPVADRIRRDATEVEVAQLRDVVNGDPHRAIQTVARAHGGARRVLGGEVAAPDDLVAGELRGTIDAHLPLLRGG